MRIALLTVALSLAAHAGGFADLALAPGISRAVASPQASNTSLAGQLTLTGGYRSGHVEGGAFGEVFGASQILGASADAVGIGAFAGLQLPLNGWLAFEVRGRLGVHQYWLVDRLDGSATLAFAGLEPRLAFRFGSGRARFVLALSALADLDFASETVQTASGPIRLGGVSFCAGPSLGVDFL